MPGGWIPFKKQVPRSPPQVHTPSDCPSPTLAKYRFSLSRVKGGYWAYLVAGCCPADLPFVPPDHLPPSAACCVLGSWPVSIASTDSPVLCLPVSLGYWRVSPRDPREEREWLEILIPILSSLSVLVGCLPPLTKGESSRKETLSMSPSLSLAYDNAPSPHHWKSTGW